MPSKDVIRIKNRNGLSAKFIRLGARWTEMRVPDRNGVFGDVLLGFTREQDYLRAEEKYHGAVVGRYCGRIAQGKFTDGEANIQLPLNAAGKHHLHGGQEAFHVKKWSVVPEEQWEALSENTRENTVVFSFFSEDGEEGYPGNLQVKVTYTLTDEDELIFEAIATTDKTTLVNLTNHAFFNLSGKAVDLEGHNLEVNGNLLAQDDEFLVTGETTALEKPSQVPLKNVVTSAFLIESPKGQPAIVFSEPHSGRSMKVFTNQKAVQLYNGFFMTGSDKGKKGEKYQANTGLAIEPQYLAPDGLNVLNPGETYRHRTIYEFGIA